MKNALVILANGFEEIEAVTPIDLLRRAGVSATVAALGPEKQVTGKNGILLTADEVLAGVRDQVFDLLVLPGGPGVQHLRNDPHVLQLAREQNQAGRPIGAICAAPLVLLDAGLLDGRRHTAHPSTSGELPEALAGERVVFDQNLITSRGAGTAVDFGLALVEELAGPEKVAEIQQAICA